MNTFPEELYIICFSTADWNATHWTNKQHLMSRLSKNGFKILYIESLALRAPGMNSKDLHRIIQRIWSWKPLARYEAENILLDTPLVLPFSNLLSRKINSFLLKWRIKRNLKHHKIRKYIFWIYNPTVFPILASFSPLNLIYHCVDNLKDYPGINGKLLTENENNLINDSDVIAVSSKPLYNMVSKKSPKKLLYWPNPADSTELKQGIPKHGRFELRRIGFIGAIQEHKLNVTLINGVAKALPEIEFHFYGPLEQGLKNSQISKVSWQSNIIFHGTLERSKISEALETMDIGWIPYNLNDYTNFVFPMKVFEYFSAGIPVISTSLPSLLDEVPFLKFADTVEETLFAISKIKYEERIESAERLQRISLAQANSWENRTREAVELLKELLYNDEK